MNISNNTLYSGDNLDIMRSYIPNESIDMVYLDPPFNSHAEYNILFKESSGKGSDAQIQAFSDFWHWDIQAKHAYDYLTLDAPNQNVANLMEALFKFLGKNDMLAYLVMMGVRLLELHKVLKQTGSIFPHCDPTSSHYLKILLDSIFDVKNFRNEIVWKRTSAHTGEGKILTHGSIHDVLLFYSKGEKYTFNPQYTPHDPKYLETFYRHVDQNDRRYRIDNLKASGIRHGDSGKPWHGIDPSNEGMHWKYRVQDLDELEKKGRIYFPKKVGGVPAYIRYLDEMSGVLLQDIWTDIPPISSQAKERMGFQTQKPMALLERIIKSCSNEGDWILDPFCGCGTAIIAAERLNRHWVGIDITWLAINLVKGRLNDMFPGIQFKIEGEPRDMGAAKELAKKPYQFQWWALTLIEARPVGSTLTKPREGKKGADEGIDGWLRFADGAEGHVEKIVVQVKSGHVGVKDIRELRDVVSRQKAAIGLFLTLEEPTSEMVKETKTTDPYISFTWRHEYPKIQILTINELIKGKRPHIPPTIAVYQEAPLAKRVPTHQQKKLFT